MTRINCGFDETMGVESFLNHICNKPGTGQMSQFETYLSNNFSWFYQYIDAESRWLFDAEINRTDAVHRRILNKIEKFNIDFMWHSLQTLSDAPKYSFEGLKFLDSDVLVFSDYNIKKLNSFLLQICKLNEEILKSRRA